jgi:hypothetical protein
MREHDELTSDDAVAGPQLERTASPADDHGETVTVSGNAPPDTPSRQIGMFALLAAVACTVFGAKLITVSALGSPMPLLDQWDGEAENLYAPYLRGTLSFADLFAPYNGHRMFVTRVLALAHLELAGEWNTRLEMILCAIVHTALITWLAALLIPLVVPQRRMLLACFVAFLFAFPIGYENTLLGFNFHFYTTLFFGIAALVTFAAARPFSWRWFGGLVAAILSYLSLSSGVATILAAGILVSLQLAANARRRCGREFAAVVVMASIALAMILSEASVANSMSTSWTFIQGLVLFTSRVILAVIPTVWFCQHTLARRPAISDRAWVAVGIAGWVGIQLVLLAYGRGTLVAPRYMDILLLVYPVGLVAVLAFVDGSGATRFSRYAERLAVAWVFTVVAAVVVLGYDGTVRGGVGWSNSARQQLVNVKAYLATRNVDHLKPTGVGGHTVDVSYPNPQRLAEVLGDPDVRAILPPELRPADADNAGARNRMVLKGAVAGPTASAVHLILAMGPALLALGLGLFFAVGARRGRVTAR